MFQRMKAAWSGRAACPAPEPELDDVERRVWVRYPCDIATVCRSLAETADLRLSAQVRNISRGGTTLLTCRPFSIGTLVSVELPGASILDSCTVLAYVVARGALRRWGVRDRLSVRHRTHRRRHRALCQQAPEARRGPTRARGFVFRANRRSVIEPSAWTMWEMTVPRPLICRREELAYCRSNRWMWACSCNWIWGTSSGSRS